MKRLWVHFRRVNHASIGAFAAIASFDPWEGAYPCYRIFGQSPDHTLARMLPLDPLPEEELELMARYVLPRERGRQRLWGSVIFSGSYFSFVFHIANTIEAIWRAMVSFAKFGFVPPANRAS